MIATSQPLRLPRADGSLESYSPASHGETLPERAAPPRTRVAYAAADVVADPRADVSPWLEAAVDWDLTLAYRRYLWQLGFPLPRRWTPPSAAWVWTGLPRAS